MENETRKKNCMCIIYFFVEYRSEARMIVDQAVNQDRSIIGYDFGTVIHLSMSCHTQ